MESVTWRNHNYSVVVKNFRTCCPCRLLSDPNYNQRDCRNAAPLPDQIVKFALVVSWPRRHFPLKFLHRQNLDTNIDYVADIECHVLYK